MGWLLVWATRKPQWLLHVEKMHVIFLPISLMYFSFLFYWHVFQASEFHWNLLGIWIAKFVWSNVDCLLLYKRKMLIPVGNYMFKVTIETLEKRYEICSKLTIKTPKWRQWRRFGVFIVNFEHIPHLCSSFSIVNFEQVNAGWDKNSYFQYTNEKNSCYFSLSHWDVNQLFQDGGLCHIETIPLASNQWTNFCMTETSIMKE